MAPRTRAPSLRHPILATCAVAGSFINQRVAAQSATDESTCRDSLHAFTGVYSLIEQNYAEKLTNDKTDKAIYDGADPGHASRSGPHSNFYDPKAFAQMRRTACKYYGVGMSITAAARPHAKGGPRLLSWPPFEGTPPYKAGIRPGDVIMSIGRQDTEAWTLQRLPLC